MPIDEKPVEHPYLPIDSYIESQNYLLPYLTNEEVDGTVGDYMELMVQFSFLSLFSLAFPMAYFIAFLNNTVGI